MKWIFLLLSFVAGIASATQGLFNGYWQERLDLKAVLLANAAVVFAAALFYYLWGIYQNEARPWSEATPSIVVGGLCGLVIVVALALAFPKIGAFRAIVLFIAGQLLAALVFDHFGVLNLPAVPIGWQKLLGALLVGIGAYLVLP
jgi:transporter family-2 protein